MSDFRNTILRALAPQAIERLHLEQIKFEIGQEIEFPGKPICYLHFVESGMASLTTTFKDGSQVEVGMFGYESVIGISALMGTRQSLNRVYTQIAGSGYRCALAYAETEFRRAGLFQKLALRYVQAQLVQAMQSAGCNAKHEVEQRLARWLLICSDRAGSDTFMISQEFLAEMLGTRRTTVTGAAQTLKQSQLIAYSRGHLQLLDRDGLEKRACECYYVIRNHLENFAEFDSGSIA